MTTRTVIAADGTVTTRELTAPEIAELAATAPTPEQVLAAWRAARKVSAFQARAALYAEGKLTAAEAIVTAAGGLKKLAWDNAIEFRRLSPAILELAPLLWPSDTPQELELRLDALFVTAAGIEA